MKKFIKKLTALTLSVSLLFQMNVSGLQVQAKSTSASDDYLTTRGSDIINAEGNVVRLTGANWFGFNCMERILHGVGWGADFQNTLYECAERGINLLRIPISTELLLEWKAGKTVDLYAYITDPNLLDANGKVINNLELFDRMMGYCKEYGIKVMVDVHSPDANNTGHNHPVWYNDEFSTEQWIEGWEWLVERYKDDDTLIACDLKNEPHGKRDEQLYAKWDDSKDDNNWKYAAERCGKAILDINPNLLIMVEGIETNPIGDYDYDVSGERDWAAGGSYKYYDGAWWGGNLRMVKRYPLDFGNEEYNKQLVYSPHDYGPLVWKQTWFEKDFNEQTLLDDYWYDAWAYLVEKGTAPLLIGEWGGFLDGADNEKWMNLIADYMNKKNISHTFWCINTNSGDTGGLLENDWVTWDEDKYAILEQALFKDEAGNYVGLDHEVALGSHGISMNTYNAELSGETPATESTAVPTTRKTTQPTTKAPVEVSTDAITSERQATDFSESTNLTEHQDKPSTEKTTTNNTSSGKTEQTTEQLPFDTETDTTEKSTSRSTTKTTTENNQRTEKTTAKTTTRRTTETTSDNEDESTSTTSDNRTDKTETSEKTTARTTARRTTEVIFDSEDESTAQHSDNRTEQTTDNDEDNNASTSATTTRERTTTQKTTTTRSNNTTQSDNRSTKNGTTQSANNSKTTEKATNQSNGGSNNNTANQSNGGSANGNTTSTNSINTSTNRANDGSNNNGKTTNNTAGNNISQTTTNATTTTQNIDNMKVGSTLTNKTAKYKITKLVKQNGTITGGTVEYSAPADKKAGSVTIANTITFDGVSFKITSIGKNACTNMKSLKTVRIGTNVTTIGKNAFKGCKKLSKVQIHSKKLKKIGTNAFKNIYSKAAFSVPSSKKTAYAKLIKRAGFSRK